MADTLQFFGPGRGPPRDVPDPAWAVALAYLPLVERHARGFRRGRFDFDDLVQEGLIAVHDAAPKQDPARGSFEKLANRAVHNRMLDWLRWHARDGRATGDVDVAEARADRVDAVALDDAFLAVWSLPDRRRTILSEHFGLAGPARTASEIGGGLGMKRDAVAKNQSRALAMLRTDAGVVP
jgi:RNA polymerase sigma factor (sigma-70 family)